MADRTIMNAKDAVSASLAECFVTIGDNRYNFMQAINLEANFEKNKTEVPIWARPARAIRPPAGRVRVPPPSTITLPSSVS